MTLKLSQLSDRFGWSIRRSSFSYFKSEESLIPNTQICNANQSVAKRVCQHKPDKQLVWLYSRCTSGRVPWSLNSSWAWAFFIQGIFKVINDLLRVVRGPKLCRSDLHDEEFMSNKSLPSFFKALCKCRQDNLLHESHSSSFILAQTVTSEFIVWSQKNDKAYTMCRDRVNRVHKWVSVQWCVCVCVWGCHEILSSFHLTSYLLLNDLFLLPIAWGEVGDRILVTVNDRFKKISSRNKGWNLRPIENRILHIYHYASWSVNW